MALVQYLPIFSQKKKNKKEGSPVFPPTTVETLSSTTPTRGVNPTVYKITFFNRQLSCLFPHFFLFLLFVQMLNNMEKEKDEKVKSFVGFLFFNSL